jgi:hypothetical protein
MQTLADLEGIVGEAVLDEAAAATPGRDAGIYLASALEAAKASEIVVDLRIARQVALSDFQSRSDAPPWQFGREAAQRVREIAGLGDRPVRSKAFSVLLEVIPQDLQGRGAARNLPIQRGCANKASVRRSRCNP